MCYLRSTFIPTHMSTQDKGEQLFTAVRPSPKGCTRTSATPKYEDYKHLWVLTNNETQSLASETYSAYNHELSRSSRPTSSLDPHRCRGSASSSQIFALGSNPCPRLPRRDHNRGSLRHNPPQAVRRRKNLPTRVACNRQAMYGSDRLIPGPTWRHHISGGTATGLYKTGGV